MNKNFLLFRFAELSAALSSNMAQIAIIWWVLQQSDSKTLAIMMTVTTFTRLVILALFNPLGDIFSAKNILIIGYLLGACTYFALGYIVYLNHFDLAAVIFFSVLVCILEAIITPIAISIVPLLVEKEELKRAMQFEGTLQAFSIIIGKVISGVLIGIIGIFMSVLLSALGLILASILIKLITNLKTKTCIEYSTTSSYAKMMCNWFKELIYGYQLLIKIPLEFWWAIVSAIVNFTLTPFILLGLPFIIKNLMHLDALHLGLLEASIAIGMLVGANCTVKVMSKYITDDITCILGLFIAGLCILFHAFTVSFYISTIIIFILGNAIMLHNVNSNTRRMLAIPDQCRARLSGAAKVLIEGSIPLGFLILGYLLEHIGAKYSFIILGYISIFISPLLYFAPKFVLLLRSSVEDSHNFYTKQYPKIFFRDDHRL